MNTSIQKLSVTTILDENSKIFTAFINDFPGVIVQGKSTDECKDKLKLL